jgi:DNA-binding beta-propeller fold protein YncE
MACGLAAGCTVAGAPTAAWSPAGAPFVYVTGKGGTNEISQFASLGSGALRPLTPRNVADGEFPYDVAVSPQGTSAYAVDNLSNTAGAVSQYTLNPATGKLTPKSPRTVATAGVPSGIITVSPDGKNAYVPSGKAISQYRISAVTGKLTPMPPRTVAGAGSPIGIKVAPDGRYLYITTGTQCLAPKGSKGKCTASAKANTVSVFGISPATGALSAKPVSTGRTVPAPEAIALSPDGKNAYVTSEGEGALSQFAISPVTGKITPLSPATVTAPSHGSLGVAVTP